VKAKVSTKSQKATQEDEEISSDISKSCKGLGRVMRIMRRVMRRGRLRARAVAGKGRGYEADGHCKKCIGGFGKRCPHESTLN